MVGSDLGTTERRTHDTIQAVAVVAAVALLALILRLLAASGQSIVAESDEVGYLSDGLLLLEGLPLGYKHVPSAPIAWLVAAYGAIQTSFGLLFGSFDPATPVLLRPLRAMERVLFAHYADMRELRLLVVVFQIVLGTLAAAAIAYRGWRLAGLAGALLAGAMAAATPLLVEFTGQARSYSCAWSLALLAFAALPMVGQPRRAMVVGLLLGLAIATRIEMVLCLPPILAELAKADTAQSRRRTLLLCFVTVVATFLIVAPWYVTSLIGNLRQIVDVRFLVTAGPAAPLNVLRSLALSGAGVPLLATILSLILLSRGRGRYLNVAVGFWLLLLGAMALRQSGGGFRHDGPVLLIAAAMVPVAVRQAVDAAGTAVAARRVVEFVAILIAATAVLAGGYATWMIRQSAVHGDPVRWIEANVAPGSRIFLDDGFAVPLPTRAASDFLWAEAAGPDAWRAKYERAARRLSLGDDEPPRAMSEDPLQLERAQRRRWFLLGASIATARPRYDIRLVGAGSVFAVPQEAAIDALCTHGGVYLHAGAPFDRLGPPKVVWTSQDPGRALMIYVIEAPSPGAGPRC